MFSNAIISATAALLACSSFAAAAPQGKASEVRLTTKLRLADTFIDRYSLLPEDKDFLFNFNSTPSAIANSQSFPALTGSGLSLASAQIPGCSMIMLHTHPRASELFAVMSGRVYTEAVPEVGVLDAEGKPRVIRNEISAGQATIFYQGTKHYQVNPDCEAANAIAAFPSEDIGFAGVAPGLFAVKDNAVIRLLGEAVDGEDVEKIRASIPTDMGIKVDECLAKCGKQKRQA
ncbi:spherulin 1B precursor [Fusarium phyllophilum]|uniref:Spherulin 1B n=1 Tax=Fusarium phyllophilum TaxID=47803 RepID=A0A8H5NI10_9HYPO|nr:spherulin 1B precursor [Fusarium phyllophilum]